MNFNDKVNTIINIFNIPLKEKWKKYLGNDYFNYYLYLHHSGLTGSANVVTGNSDTYVLVKNRNINSYFRKTDNYFECDNYDSKIIADVGCGWGLLSFWYALSGAKKVYAIGYEYQVEFIQKLIASAKSNGLVSDAFSLIPVAKPLENNNKTLGDLEEETAGYVVYNDVFEHIADHYFDNALKASYNTLRRGGKLISVTHNTDNTAVMKRISSYWDKLETEYIAANRKKYIISRLNGETENNNIDKLVNATRGMMKNEIDVALNNFKRSGFIHQPSALRPAVDLETDYLCENYISPPAVISKMKSAGFDAYCYAGIYHTGRYRLLQPLAKIFKKLFMKIELFSGTVVFVGRK